MNKTLVVSMIAASIFAAGCAPGKGTISRDLPTTELKVEGLTEEEIGELTPGKVVFDVADTPSEIGLSNVEWTASVGRTKPVDPTQILGTIAGLSLKPWDKNLWSLFGQQAWAIVEKNKPVVGFENKSLS
ncbi:MAG: hypothetical protein V4692_14865, partial [Bdellovibrionota bacterium]